LYYKESNEEKRSILVLDNDLSIYHTTIDDVVLRKSPYVKEMVSIKNVIKILNDGDVVVSKKEESVKAIQKECIDMLDLSFDENDLAEIEKSGSFFRLAQFRYAVEQQSAAGKLLFVTLR